MWHEAEKKNAVQGRQLHVDHVELPVLKWQLTPVAMAVAMFFMLNGVNAKCECGSGVYW